MNPCNVRTIKCAQCGALRGAANGWYVVTRLGEGFATIRHAGQDEDDLPDDQDAICGKECLLREISEIF